MKLSIEEATEIALNYSQTAGNTWSKVESVKYEEGNWIVRIDVGVYSTKIKPIRIYDSTGKVVAYE